MLRTITRSFRKSPLELGLARHSLCRHSLGSIWRFRTGGINPPKYEFTKSPIECSDIVTFLAKALPLNKGKSRVSTASLEAGETTTPEIRYSLWDLVAYFTRLGTFGFGGPVALVGYMHRDLVEKRQWISEQDYREGLALAQLAPGPLAAQLAIYL